MSTRPSSSGEAESEASLVLSHDEFMMAVDRDEFLEVKYLLIFYSISPHGISWIFPRNIYRIKLAQKSIFTLDHN